MPAFAGGHAVHETRHRATFQARGLPPSDPRGCAMKKAPLYSRSRQRPGLPARSTTRAAEGREPSTATPSPTDPAATGAVPSTGASSRRTRWNAFLDRHRIAMLAFVAAMLVLIGGVGGRSLIAIPVALTQKDIDAAVRHSLEKEPLPSAYAKAYAAVRPSVVRVVGLDEENEEPPKPGDDPRQHTRTTATGVVSIDNGTILT